MPTHAAFLRAVNLGSTRKASGADLRAAFEGMGFGEVATFRNSGNVVFAAGRESSRKLTERIEAGLADGLGFDVPVFLRSEAELKALAAQQPFSAKEVEASEGKLQVLLLDGKPSAAARKKVKALAGADDRLAFGDRELYWLPSTGIRDSKLDLQAIDAALGKTTMRTKGTIEQLTAKYFG